MWEKLCRRDCSKRDCVGETVLGDSGTCLQYMAAPRPYTSQAREPQDRRPAPGRGITFSRPLRGDLNPILDTRCLVSAFVRLSAQGQLSDIFTASALWANSVSMSICLDVVCVCVGHFRNTASWWTPHFWSKK